MSVNEMERAICKQRGHHRAAIAQNWMQCKWCGVWHRTVQVLQERTDDPPADEQDVMQQLNKRREHVKELLS